MKEQLPHVGMQPKSIAYAKLPQNPDSVVRDPSLCFKHNLVYPAGVV